MVNLAKQRLRGGMAIASTNVKEIRRERKDLDLGKKKYPAVLAKIPFQLPLSVLIGDSPHPTEALWNVPSLSPDG